MSIAFEKISYLQALKENENLNDDKKIFNYVKEGLQFKYGDVSRQKFNVKYSAEGWLGRKIFALPAAVWSGVIKAIYHLAKAIFGGIPKAFSDKGQYLIAQLFYVARDFQESYGRLTSLFNDRYGQFHVQESLFQKTCYECFITNATLSTSTTRSNAESGSFSRSSVYTTKYGVWVDSEAEVTSLSNYKEKAVEERNKLIQRFDLKQISSKLPSSNMSLDDFVGQADPEILKVLTLEDLIIPFQHSKLKFALLEEEKFNALTIGDLDEEINEAQFSIIQQRLKKLSKNDPQQKGFDAYSDVKGIPLKDLAQFSASDIHKHKENIPGLAFAFFTNEQIQNLKLSEMQASQNEGLFFALNEAEAKARLALFDEQDIVDAIHKKLITGNILTFLSDDLVKKLKLSQLNKDQVSILFCWKSNSNQDARRFKAFHKDEVQKAIEAGNLTTTYQLKLLSEEQLKGIKLSKLSKDTIDYMFPWSSDNTEDLKRFAYFEVVEVQAALNSKLIMSTYKLKLLSTDQLKGIKLSKLSKDTIDNMFPWSSDNTADLKRFANFEAVEVNDAIISELITSTYQLKLLSNAQLKGVQLSKLSRDTIDNMFPWSSDNTADLKRFANFEAVEVNAALISGLLTRTYQLTLLSSEQLKSVQLSKLSRNTIDNMFPWSSNNAADRKRFANFDALEVKAAKNKGKLNDYQVKLISSEQQKKF